MHLVAFVGKDKENWGQVKALIRRIDSEKIIIVKDKNIEAFPTDKECKILEFDTNVSLQELRNNFQDKLRHEFKEDFEVALSIASGSGKEHMALVSALLNIPLGVKLVAYTQKGIEFFT